VGALKAFGGRDVPRRPSGRAYIIDALAPCSRMPDGRDEAADGATCIARSIERDVKQRPVCIVYRNGPFHASQSVIILYVLAAAIDQHNRPQHALTSYGTRESSPHVPNAAFSDAVLYHKYKPTRTCTIQGALLPQTDRATRYRFMSVEIL